MGLFPTRRIFLFPWLFLPKGRTDRFNGDEVWTIPHSRKIGAGLYREPNSDPILFFQTPLEFPNTNMQAKIFKEGF